MRQRAMIAMALANDPKVLIADEPTTALDVTVQAQILELIARLQAELGMGVVIITHDLGVVAETADDIAVMYAGRIVEQGSTDTLFDGPEHPYTWGLLESIPKLSGPREEKLIPIPGRPPSLIHRPGGCAFHPRCPYVRETHKRIDPKLEPVPEDPGHRVACLLPHETRRELWAKLRAGEEARAGPGGGSPAMSDNLVEVRDLVKHFPHHPGDRLPEEGRRRARRGRDLVRRTPGRDAGHRRRDRLRQEHHGQAAAAPARRPRAARSTSTARRSPTSAAATSSDCGARCR